MKPTRVLIAEFTCEGEPVSKARARFTKRGSKTYAYTPEKTLDGERRIAWTFRSTVKHLGVNPTDTAIAYRVECEFYNGTRQRRDVDNMTKLVLDGLNKVAWVDDDQVLEIEARKQYVEKADARTVVRVFEIGRIAVPEAACIRCGRAFRTYESWAANPSGKKYCSRECGYAHRVERRQRTCKACGVSFLAWGQTHETKFCSVACKASEGRVRVACAVCGVEFFKQRSAVRRTNLCSQECMRKSDAERNKARRSKHFPGTCLVCGAGTTRKEYARCNACKRANLKPSGRPTAAPALTTEGELS